jgi:hypothetical protein
LNELIPVEYQNQRILTSRQLAEGYGAEPRRITENFNNNKKRYIPGKHYFRLEGDDLKAFKRNYDNIAVAEHANTVYLWTEKGAFLHAKTLGTDKAWEVYDELVESYFRKGQHFLPQLTQNEMMLQIVQNAVVMEKEMNSIKGDVAVIKQTVRESTEKLDAAFKVFANPSKRYWVGDMKEIIEDLIKVHRLSKPKFYERIYKELEQIDGKLDLDNRLTRHRNRMKTNGKTSKQCMEVSKLDIISFDSRLHPVFEGVVRRHQAIYAIQGIQTNLLTTTINTEEVPDSEGVVKHEIPDFEGVGEHV